VNVKRWSIPIKRNSTLKWDYVKNAKKGYGMKINWDQVPPGTRVKEDNKKPEQQLDIIEMERISTTQKNPNKNRK
jgi:hypothetical protein